MKFREQKKENFVIISNIEWGFLKQRHQSFALALSKKYNVVFVESSAKRNPSFKDIPRIFKRIMNLFKPSINSNSKKNYGVRVVTPVILPSTLKLFRMINKISFSRRLAEQIIRKLNENKKTIIMTYLPTETALDIIELIDHDILIYDCVSNFASVAGMAKDTIDIEKSLIRKSNLVITDCDYLYKNHEKQAKRIELIEPGVEWALFNKIQGLKCDSIKKLCYFGLISDKIDFDLLKFLVDKGIEITMIGPVVCEHDVLNCLKLKDEVKHADLPEEIRDADALIIPYVSNEFMKGVISAKFFECFATGKPLITTYSENYARYDDLILQGKSYEEIFDLINNVEKNETKDKQAIRVDISRKQDWNNLGGSLIALVDEL